MEVDNMNPCKNCTRVPDPDACDNKQCQEWQVWWKSCWEKTCLTILRLLSKRKSEKEKRD